MFAEVSHDLVNREVIEIPSSDSDDDLPTPQQVRIRDFQAEWDRRTTPLPKLERDEGIEEEIVEKPIVEAHAPMPTSPPVAWTAFTDDMGRGLKLTVTPSGLLHDMYVQDGHTVRIFGATAASKEAKVCVCDLLCLFGHAQFLFQTRIFYRSHQVKVGEAARWDMNVPFPQGDGLEMTGSVAHVNGGRSDLNQTKRKDNSEHVSGHVDGTIVVWFHVRPVCVSGCEFSQ
jgi:hypothetical protein